MAWIANRLGARIVATRDGHHLIVPRRAEAHTNRNIIKVPRRRARIVGARLPDGPEAE